jgi:sugar lactone lactonase YvrE
MFQIIFLIHIIAVFAFAAEFEEIARFGGMGSTAGQLNNPNAISVTPDAKLYAVDTGNNRIQIFSMRGEFIKSVGGFGFKQYQFDHPLDIWTKSVMNYYISDYNNNRIERYNRDFSYIASFENDEETGAEFGFAEVSSTVVNSQQEMFILSCSENKILKFNRHNEPERVFADYESGAGELEQPQQMDLWGERYLAVSDAALKAVLIYDFFGNFIHRIADERIQYPSGLFSADDGTLWLVDKGKKMIFQIGEDFQLNPIKLKLTVPLSSPKDIALYTENKNNLLYILDDHEIIICKKK